MPRSKAKTQKRTRPRRGYVDAKRLSAPASWPTSLPLERIWRRVLERRLRAKLAARVSLSIHDNTHTMISFQRRRGEYRLRLHHMFLAASEPLVTALAAYVKGGDDAVQRQLDKFIQQNRVYIRRVSSAELRARVPIEPAGEVHQLQEIHTSSTAASSAAR